MNKRQMISLLFISAAFVFFGAVKILVPGPSAAAQDKTAARPTPPPTAAAFDQAAALAAVRESIRGKETEPAEKVFKNIQILKGVPAARIPAIMSFGYARSLGVDCTHCHTPEKWESDAKPQKQIAREMAAMVAEINGTLLKNIKNLKSDSPAVNCTTCHRGELRPALNLPAAAPDK